MINFNSQVKQLLISKGVSVDDGISYLLCIYYRTSPSFIPEVLERRVAACNIFTKDYSSNSITWNIPLFEESESGFEWITEWMDLFSKVNPERRGVKAFVLKRMKDFFINNPSVRKDEVLRATRAYLSTVTDPKYCKKSHKFIYEQDGSSMLGDYVASTRSKEENSEVWLGSNLI